MNKIAAALTAACALFSVPAMAGSVTFTSSSTQFSSGPVTASAKNSSISGPGFVAFNPVGSIAVANAGLNIGGGFGSTFTATNTGAVTASIGSGSVVHTATVTTSNGISTAFGSGGVALAAGKIILNLP